MKKGKRVPEVQSQAGQELDDILGGLDSNPPIHPSKQFPYCTDNKDLTYKFYLRIRPHVKNWWRDFCERRDQQARWFYKTAYAFAKTMQRRHVLKVSEIALIEEMIGPEPELQEGEKELRVPWLGDWVRERSDWLARPENTRIAKSLALAIRDDLDNRKAVRSLAPFLIHEMARYDRMHDKVDEAFGGEPFLASLKPDSNAAKKRADLYLGFHRAVLSLQLRLSAEWMAVFGVDRKSPAPKVEYTQLGGQVSGQLLLPAEGGGQIQVPGGVSLDAVLMAQHWKMHGETFGDEGTPDHMNPKKILEAARKAVDKDEQRQPNRRTN